MIIEYCYYPHGNTKALSFSYDDGRIEDIRMTSTLNQYNLKGSFNLNSSKIDTSRYITTKQLKTIYGNHEIASHTATHPFVTNIPSVDLVREILEDKAMLEQLSGRIVRGFAYPFGYTNATTDRVVSVCGLDYCRTALPAPDFILPDNFLQWGPTCHHNQDIFEILDRFGKLDEKPWRTLQFFNIAGHSYEFEEQHNWNRLEEFCKRACELPKTWFATNLEVCDYITALRGIKESADHRVIYNPWAQSVWIGVDREPVEIKGGETLRLS